MSEIELANGLLVSPDVHDAKVLGLLLVGDELFLPLKLVDGSSVNLVFHDVQHLRAMDFREGNIALDMEVLIGSEVDAGDIASLYDVNPASSGDVVSQLLNRVQSEGKLVAKLNASYGCSLTCVCSEISVSPNGVAQLMRIS